LFDAPTMARFIPGLALSTLLDRLSYMPERILVRDMRFRVVSLARTAGELGYAATSVLLAAHGWGGSAIVGGNVIRSLAKLLCFAGAANARDWLEPCRLSFV